MIRSTFSLVPALVSALVLLLQDAGQAQQPAAGIGFRNETTVPIVVQGASLVNGMLRRGQLVTIPSGKMGWDTNLPKGPRYLIIYDGSQTSRVLYRDQPPIQFQGYDLIFRVRPHPTQRDSVLLVLQPSAP